MRAATGLRDESYASHLPCALSSAAAPVVGRGPPRPRNAGKRCAGGDGLIGVADEVHDGSGAASAVAKVSKRLSWPPLMRAVPGPPGGAHPARDLLHRKLRRHQRWFIDKRARAGTLRDATR